MLWKDTVFMLNHPGHHIGDTWYYVENEIIHCFYLTCPDTIERHTSWDIGHATSTNLTDWTRHNIILRKGEPDTYDGRCPATGSVIRFKNRYWLAYTGNWNGPHPTAALAVSDDLFHWEKVPYNPITTIDSTYYDNTTPRPSPRDFLHWRDPFLFEHGGAIYHYVCANRNSGPIDERGVLGLAKTSDMVTWTVLPPPEVDPVCTEMECPQVYRVKGRYYLIFSAMPDFFSKAFQQHYKPELRTFSSYAMVGESIFGPFRIHGNGQIIPHGYPQTPYANQIVFWQGQAYLLGTVWNAEQDFICDPLPIEFTETGVKLAGHSA
jgi:beta-fructofuranosidase